MCLLADTVCYGVVQSSCFHELLVIVLVIAIRKLWLGPRNFMRAANSFAVSGLGRWLW